MDDLYPGWNGLQAGASYLVSQILQPLKTNGSASWQQWDWARNIRGGDDVGDGWRELREPGLVIVEGCGSGSLESLELSDDSVWIESGAETRRNRFLSRDSGIFSNEYANWTLQEDEFYQKNRTTALCAATLQN